MKLALSFLFLSLVQGNVITEKMLIDMAKESPDTASFEANSLQAKLGYLQTRDGFQASAYGTGSYSNSSEAALVSFVPIFGPTVSAGFGIQKQTLRGVGFKIGAFSDQTSTTSGAIDRINRTGYRVEVSVDLWKDLFGKTSKNTLESLEFQSKRAKIESEVFTQSLIYEVRKLYWTLVANNEALKIANELLSTAKKQRKDIIARKRNNIADSGDVARVQAQVANREAQLIGLKYQKEILLKSLKQLLPELPIQNVTLATYDVEKTIDDVLSCTTAIMKEIDPPLNNTKYDEIVELIEKAYKKQRIMTETYDDVDVQLAGEFQSSGVGREFGPSYDNFDEDPGSTVGVGLTVTVPIDGRKKKSKTTLEILDEKRKVAMAGKYMADLKANHLQFIQSIRLLNQVVETQGKNSKYLAQSLRTSQRKYKQARISLNDLINDQDLLLQSNLSEIDAKLEVINSLFDYLKVFQQTPCNLNRMNV